MTVSATIDVWMDVICPWCAIGHARLKTARELLANEIELEIRIRPFELDSETPAGGVDSNQRMMRNYDRTPEQVAEMTANVERVAEEAGISFAWTGEGEPPRRIAWNTFRAHKLLTYALDRGDAARQERVMDALFAAHFPARENIEDEAVLIACGAAGGFSADEVRAAIADEARDDRVRAFEYHAQRIGIRGVPALLVDNRILISGAHEPAAYAEALREIVSQRA